MYFSKHFLLYFSTLLLLIGCKNAPVTTPQNTSATLFDKAWILQSFGTKKQISTDKEDPLEVFFSLESKQISGNAGCNRFFGNYEMRQQNLQIKGLGLTKKLCPEEIMKTEETFLRLLQKTDSYEIANNTLLLKQGEKTLLVFALKEIE